MLKWLKNIFFFLGFCFPLLGVAQNIPARSSTLVTDYTSTLSRSELNALEEKLVAFDRESSSQVAIVIIRSLEGYDIAGYANELFNKWGIGGKKNNNGVLVLVAMDDKKMRIETGYGMEGAMPDAIAKRIIENDMKPAFRAGNYYDGLNKAADNIIAYTKGEYKAEGSYGAENEAPFPIYVIFLILLVFALILVFRVREAQQYSRINHISFWAAWALLNALRNKPGGKWRDFSSGRGSFGGWSGGGSSWSSGGSGGFGGFGGGRSGGGGASGSW